MKPRLVFALFPTLLALLMFAGANNAAAADFRVSIGNGRHEYRRQEYRTSDALYGTWYPESSTSYGYSNNVYSGNTYYSTPYVYSTPSVEFSTWYGDGYRSRSGSYGGRNGYSGGYSGGRYGGSRR